MSEANGSAIALPPGPRRPAALQTLQWFARPVRMLEDGQKRFGDVFPMRLGPAQNIILVADPQAAKAALNAPPQKCYSGDTNGLWRPVLGSNSVVVLDGERHLEQRRIILPALKGGHIQDFTETIAEITRRRIATWPLGRPFQMQPELEAITFDVMMRIGFGTPLDARHEQLRTLVPDMMDRCTSPWLMLPWLRHRDLWGFSPPARAKAVLAQVDEILFSLIRDRRADPLAQVRNDVLSTLVRARHEDDESLLDDREVRDELLTVLLAGYETTNSAITWALERLLRTPHVLGELLRQLDDEEDAYLDAVVKETVRIRPPVPIVGRKPLEPMQFGDYTFPADSILLVCIYLVHRHPDAFPDPEAFRPERYLGRKREPEFWMPFGAGARRCMGANIAQLELKVVLRTVLENVELHAPDSTDEPIARRRFTFTPKSRGVVVATSNTAQSDPNVPRGTRFRPERARDSSGTRA